MASSRILLTGWVLACFAPSASSDAADLSVELVAHKSTLILGEPLIITASVRNEGKETVKVHLQNSPSYELRSRNPFLPLISADGEEYQHWLDSFRPRRKTSPIKLPPGKELSSDLIILFSRRGGMAFKQPGEYWVSVRVIDTDNKSFQAEPIRITMTKPQRKNMAAWNMLGNKGLRKTYGTLVQMPWTSKLSVEDLDRCDQFLRKHPGTIYAEYLALNLARRHLEGRDINEKKGKAYLQMAESMVSSDFLAAKVKQLLERKRSRQAISPPTRRIPEP